MRTPCLYSRAPVHPPHARRGLPICMAWHWQAWDGLLTQSPRFKTPSSASQRSARAHLALSDLAIHRAYNSLLYGLGRTEKYLTSYDRAPKSRELMLARAQTLSLEKRGAEAHGIYAELLAREGKEAQTAMTAKKYLVMFPCVRCSVV